MAHLQTGTCLDARACLWCKMKILYGTFIFRFVSSKHFLYLWMFHRANRNWLGIEMNFLKVHLKNLGYWEYKYTIMLYCNCFIRVRATFLTSWICKVMSLSVSVIVSTTKSLVQKLTYTIPDRHNGTLGVKSICIIKKHIYYSITIIRGIILN